MKKLLPLLVLLALPFFASAQCTPNTTYTIPGIYPDTLPTGTVGQPYSSDITFMLPLDTGGYDFTNFEILTITLPVGLTWQCNNFANGCNYDPWVNQYGCVNVSGTPLLAGFYPIDVTVIADLTVASGIPVTFQCFIEIVPSTSSSSNNGYSMVGYDGCAPITVNFTNNNPGLQGYYWDFGNANQSTAENPAPQVYTQPGDYIVHYEAYSDTTTYNFYTLTSITITSIQNSASVWGYPVDGNPDLFVIVKENGTPVYQSNYYGDQFPVVSWTGLNVNMNPANTYVLEVWDEDDYEFGFGADDFVGSHTMSLNGCTGCAANISIVDYVVNHQVVPPTPSVITDDTVHVHGYPGIPNVVYDSLNHVLVTDTIQYSLQWYFNGSPLLGENAPSDTVWNSGDYFVVAINQWGCATFSDTVLAIWCDTSWHPDVLVYLTDLSTIDTTGNTMQWYLNGNPVPGQTADSIDAVVNGTYVLEVTNSFGCAFYSLPVVVSVGIAENNADAPALYPNPANETVNISWMGNGHNSLVQVHDISGRLVMEHATTQNQTLLDVSQLPEGTYVVTILAGESRSTARMVIAR
ncbi:MAG TPA: T9SS type A sorting domain-containing protein [Bacteroidia bacterium]|nr:T9SS type A sorting domain-containing protein [Bacteroidia bacterium]